MTWTPPGIPASAGALLRDPAGRLLLLKPTYKSGWTLPGGIMEDDGESPWDACRREVLEETGVRVHSGRLVCVDTRPAKPGRQLGLRFLFDCGVVAPDAPIRLQAEEIEQHRFVAPAAALDLLRGPVRRRVAALLDAGLLTAADDTGLPGPPATPPATGVVPASWCLYLENGRPVGHG